MAEAALLDSWIDGREERRDDQARYELVSPVDGSVASRIVDSNADLVDEAVANALAAFRAHRAVPAATRAAWLSAAADGIDAEKDAIVAALIRDIGKPVRPATFEAGRSAAFVRLAAAEIGALRGETLPLDISAQGAGRHGFTKRVPYGVVGAITPFNAPANLLVQKVAPALAMGNAVVVKPAPQGVETALIVARAFQRAGLPDGLFNIVPGNRETARALVAHPDVAVVTFTGGTVAGDALARAAGAKKFVAELGSNAANIVCADADLDDAATPDRGLGVRGVGPAMHFRPAGHRRPRRAGRFPGQIRRGGEGAHRGRSGRRSHRGRADGQPRRRRPGAGDDRRRG